MHLKVSHIQPLLTGGRTLFPTKGELWMRDGIQFWHGLPPTGSALPPQHPIPGTATLVLPQASCPSSLHVATDLPSLQPCEVASSSPLWRCRETENTEAPKGKISCPRPHSQKERNVGIGSRDLAPKSMPSTSTASCLLSPRHPSSTSQEPASHSYSFTAWPGRDWLADLLPLGLQTPSRAPGPSGQLQP